MTEELELTFFQRLEISRYGRVAIGEQTRPGWSGSLMFYAFKCTKHGYVSNYVSGGHNLKCPKCWEE